eukprot:scaffold127972_cov49-Cyclotella_meneghiniana.AAC.3
MPGKTDHGCDERLRAHPDLVVGPDGRLDSAFQEESSSSEEPTKDRLEGSSTDKAMELFQQALSLRKQCLGPNHVDAACSHDTQQHCLDYAATAFNAGQSLHQKAQIQQEQKNYEKALELYEESLLSGQAALGEYHSKIAMLLNRKCYKKGLCIELKVLPPYHLNIVVTYSNLGEIHRQRCEWDEAAQMYGAALEILK